MKWFAFPKAGKVLECFGHDSWNHCGEEGIPLPDPGPGGYEPVMREPKKDGTEEWAVAGASGTRFGHFLVCSGYDNRYFDGKRPIVRKVELIGRGPRRCSAVEYYLDTPIGRAALAAYCVTVIEWIAACKWSVWPCDAGTEDLLMWNEYSRSLCAWRDEWRRYGGLP